MSYSILPVLLEYKMTCEFVATFSIQSYLAHIIALENSFCSEVAQMNQLPAFWKCCRPVNSFWVPIRLKRCCNLQLSTKFYFSTLFIFYFLGGKNSQKIVLEKKSRRNCFGGFDAQFLQFGEKISEKKSFSTISSHVSQSDKNRRKTSLKFATEKWSFRQLLDTLRTPNVLHNSPI